MAGSTAPEPGGVFISYRRQELNYAGRLRDWLAGRFGQDRVFMDVESIEPGQDFAEAIEQAVGACDVLVALIGPQWLTMTDEKGTPRLDDPDDFVRLEIEAALQRNVRVIPLLVEGAGMPRRQDLPDSLIKLARREALGIRHAGFQADASRLVAAIEAGFYRAFWARFLDRVRDEHPDWATAQIRQKDNGITMPSGKSGAVYGCNFAAGGKRRTELYIDGGDAEANLALFQALKAQEATIDVAYGKSLSWEPVPEKGAYRIADYADGDVTNTDQHDAYIDWFLKTASGLRDALAAHWPPNGPVVAERPEAVHVLDHRYVKVQAVAFSPTNGRLLATAGEHGGLWMWDPVIGEELSSPIDSHDAVRRLAFSRDGRLLATAGRDGTARVWELATGEEQRSFAHGSDNTVWDVALSPDGRLLATASEDTARVWELTTEQQLTSFSANLAHFKPMVRVAFSPDGELLATASHDTTARVWELATGQEQTQIIHARAVFCVVFSPDGRLLATGSSDGTARVRELATGQERSFAHPSGDTVRDVAFSPDSRLLATACHDGTARLWELATGRQRAMVNHNKEPVVSVVFSPDGRLLATACHDRTARVWALVR